jgi:putative flippase GtrA
MPTAGLSAAASRYRSLGLELLRFSLVGVAGALVDMAALWVALNGLHAGPYLGRVFSYFVAATFSWACNRRLTFRNAEKRPLLGQWLQYLAVNAAGGLANFAVYSAIVATGAHVASLPAELRPFIPYFGVACGSLSGLLLNFFGSKKLIFRPAGRD